ncbi:MAG: RagB/SusD family nutrient uptake outer membrane protein [Prevotellaceae bacterium]|nr:RagB/SusD family nutrient uptake outer membrane protein [Prevotellaceae bacterium]
MKKILFALAILVSFASCDDSLELTPLGQLMGGNYPATSDDAITLINNVYRPNAGASTGLLYMIDLTTETTVSGENPNTGGGPLGSLTYAPDNSYITGAWNNMYLGITNANDAVDRIEPFTNIVETLKGRLLGEARFLRAYYYFYVVQLWGEAPLILHNIDGVKPQRAAIDDIYDQIIIDLEYASAHLPAASEYGNTDKGRASKGAAFALLQKVYLVWGQTSDTGGAAAKKEKYQKSVNAANSITGYQLEERYLDLWAVTNKNGKEDIFSTQYVTGQASDGSGGNHLAHCSLSEGFSNNKLPHVVPANERIYNLLDDRDQRKGATYVKELYNPAADSFFTYSRLYFAKYVDRTDPAGGANRRNLNRTILRLGDVLLLKAEALNELNDGPNAEAYDALNQVRRRAFQKPLNAASSDDAPAGLNYEGFKKFIQQERTFELTYEQNHWLDLVRWKILVKTIKESGLAAKDQPKEKIDFVHYRFPIPKSQRDINPEGLWQNYGYDGSIITSNPYTGAE